MVDWSSRHRAVSTRPNLVSDQLPNMFLNPTGVPDQPGRLFLMRGFHAHVHHQLHKILESMRFKRGALNFDTNEAKIMVNKEGRLVDIVLRQRGIVGVKS